MGKEVDKEMDPLHLDHLPAFPLFCFHTLYSMLVACLLEGKRREIIRGDLFQK